MAIKVHSNGNIKIPRFSQRRPNENNQFTALKRLKRILERLVGFLVFGVISSDQIFL